MKIRKCNSKIDNVVCESDEKIQKLLDKLVFTIYFITGVAELGKPQNYNKNPIKPSDKFYQQFQLDMKSYRDNNNFLSTHHVETLD